MFLLAKFQNRRSRSKTEIKVRKDCHGVEPLPETCLEITSNSNDGETTDVEEYVGYEVLVFSQQL